MFEFEVVRSKCTVLKKVLVTFLGLVGAPRSHSAHSVVIRRPRNCALLDPPRYAPGRSVEKLISKLKSSHRSGKIDVSCISVRDGAGLYYRQQIAACPSS